jgi:hypothetical protein
MHFALCGVANWVARDSGRICMKKKNMIGNKHCMRKKSVSIVKNAVIGSKSKKIAI